MFSHFPIYWAEFETLDIRQGAPALPSIFKKVFLCFMIVEQSAVNRIHKCSICVAQVLQMSPASNAKNYVSPSFRPKCSINTACNNFRCIFSAICEFGGGRSNYCEMNYRKVSCRDGHLTELKRS